MSGIDVTQQLKQHITDAMKVYSAKGNKLLLINK